MLSNPARNKELRSSRIKTDSGDNFSPKEENLIGPKVENDSLLEEQYERGLVDGLLNAFVVPTHEEKRYEMHCNLYKFHNREWYLTGISALKELIRCSPSYREAILKGTVADWMNLFILSITNVFINVKDIERVPKESQVQSRVGDGNLEKLVKILGIVSQPYLVNLLIDLIIDVTSTTAKVKHVDWVLRQQKRS